MPTVWYKRAYDRADLDPATFEALPGAIPPGIYCADEVAYRALLAGAREKGVRIEPAFGGPCLGGLTVSVATPEQAAALQAAPVSTAQEVLADDRATFDAAARRVNDIIKGMTQREYEAAQAVKGELVSPDGHIDFSFVEHQQDALEASVRRMVRRAMKGMSGEEWGRRFMGHAQAGMNRQQRRAAAARARRRTRDADLPACGSFHG
ncbi:hypothetical protein MFUR16E_21535 [Methylobacterium fujisawaense]|uniref:hypothetical protein n=1 Tax=Methylobacterium fujisawaense TaxID=107400 RepID=UPI002F30EE78